MTDFEKLKLENAVLLEENKILKKKNEKTLKKLEKYIRENNLKSIEFKEKGMNNNAMIFNTIAFILEKIYNNIKE